MKQCTVEGCTRKAQGRGLCGSHYSTWHRSQNPHTIVCAHCGQIVQVSRPNRRHCSTKCAAAHGGQASAAQRRKPRPLVLYVGPKHPVRPTIEVHTARRLTSGQCRVCAHWFVSFSASITCSDSCLRRYRGWQRRMAKDRRRARQRGAFVEKVYRRTVFERDGYRCHLCNRPTDPSKQVPHPKAPTLDHVIPLACGGTHEPSNCRTAHYLCNCLKGDRGGGEQMLLLA